MKKLFVMMVLVIAIIRQPAYAQLAVADGVVHGLMLDTKLEQVVHYAQTAAQWVKEIEHMREQVIHMAEMTERAIQNLASADIHSYKDFMDWYNRQLYLERMTIDAFKNANINIGKKNYKFSDAEGITSGIKDTYIDYWDKEFTEEQRREMWLGLGLTPANYAFVQPLRAKAHDIYRQNLFISEVQNEEYKKDMQINKKWTDKMDADKDKDSKEKMGQKEIEEAILEVEINNNRVLNNIAMYTARSLELAATEKYLDETPALAPPLSEWKPNGFRPLDPQVKQ
ncbi:MAG: hypothetical protein LBB89_02895 [Treponema sp.]|jgi:hypothetical protein|nr:hypothetical protein [Treponema sp.]